MNEAFLKVFEKLESISITLLATLCSTLGLIIFLPDSIAERLAILAFRKDYAVFLGPAFLALMAFLIARIIREATDLLRSRKAEKARKDQLMQLTAEEKGYLAEFVINGRNTVKVGIDDGIMGGLVAKKICFMSSNVFDLLDGASYNLQPWARRFLEQNPSALEGSVGVPLTPRKKMRLDRI